MPLLSYPRYLVLLSSSSCFDLSFFPLLSSPLIVHDVLSLLSCPSLVPLLVSSLPYTFCHILAAMPFLLCPCCLVLAICSCFRVLAVTSLPLVLALFFLVLTVLLCYLVFAVSSLLSCLFCLILPFLFLCCCPSCFSLFSCHCCHVLVIMYLLSCLRCHVRAVMTALPGPCCRYLSILSLL